MKDIHILASRMMTQRKQLDMIADNVANVNTTGFKRMDMDFQELVSRQKTERVGSYVKDRSLTIDFNQGTMNQTNGTFDLAIMGDAFFAVDVNGAQQYTRNGHFLKNETGTLVNEKGAPVLDIGGTPITIPAGATNIKIARDGTVSSDQGILTQIGLYSFAKEDQGKLLRTGLGGYVPTNGATAQPATANTVVLQGMLEASNVNGVTEMVNMQHLSRSYQSAAKLIQTVEGVEQRAIRSLGKSN